MPATEPLATEPADSSAGAEAARYALLRRLAPSMRHHLVVHLQPIAMVCEVMERRLGAAQPDLDATRDAVHKVSGFNRAALDAVGDVLGWLAPDPAAAVTADAAARECASLLATSLGFRGYVLRNEVAGTGLVRRSAARTLLSALLIHLADQAQAPAELILEGAAEVDALALSLTVQATDGGSGIPPEAIYRKLTWADLQALAADEGVALSRDGARTVLRLPWVSA